MLVDNLTAAVVVAIVDVDVVFVVVLRRFGL